MGVVGVVALLANGGVALMLYRYRGGDSNMRSVWICSCNDATCGAPSGVAAGLHLFMANMIILTRTSPPARTR
jgi:Co/Zn/Cd efflux system component